ncbi:MAG: 2-amino-4-hydroxy-6-hydroxymethyldihydropteridine diphosphokinase [Planctomycetota bacterium]
MGGTHTAYIGLGSNIGNRQKTLDDALESLDNRPNINVMTASSYIETNPVGGPPQGSYLNAAAELNTSLAPEDLLKALHDVEQEFGRTREQHWGPRTLDLDLLLYEQKVLKTDTLLLPHPRMHNRWFVLMPLNEIAPNAIHPVLDKSVRDMLNDVANPE